MKSTKFIAVLGAGSLALGVAACGSSSSTDTSPAAGGGGSSDKPSVQATLNGAGSTFAQPIYQQIGSELRGGGLTVNYQGVGSGDGVAQLQSGTADFAGSDPSLAPEDKSKLKVDAIQIPIAIGAITLSYNLPGVKSGVKLDGQTTADIYFGKIKKWNDPKIAAQNSGMKLPSTNITVVHRSDSSGTTKGFTTFLAAYSSKWKNGPGVDKTVKWPAGTGAKGNDGVAAGVKQTEGAIGYVEQAFALQNGFTFADVKNKSGAYVPPTLDSTSVAGDGIDVPADLGISTINSPNPKAYPIASQTFMDYPSDPCKAGSTPTVAKGLVAFAKYLLGPKGQDTINKLSYAKLPQGLVTKGNAAVAKTVCNGKAVGGA